MEKLAELTTCTMGLLGDLMNGVKDFLTASWDTEHRPELATSRALRFRIAWPTNSRALAMRISAAQRCGVWQMCTKPGGPWLSGGRRTPHPDGKLFPHIYGPIPIAAVVADHRPSAEPGRYFRAVAVTG
jgi:hypothetical protein